MEKRNEEFWAYVKREITVEQWERLTEILGCSLNRLTRLQNGTNEFDPREIRAMAKLLGVNAFELVRQYRLGLMHFNGRQLEEMAHQNGYNLFEAHVA